jgi:L-amino acid N-acyltransferase YncA
MKPAILVRPSGDADIPAIARIYGHHVLHGLASFEEVAPAVEEMARRRVDIVAKGFPYLVAEEAGQVVGYAYCSAYRPRSGYRFSVEDSIYVAPGRGGAGIGSLLLPRLVDAATALGARQMMAVIGDSANHGSIRLHARFGFRHAGTLEAIGFKLGRWVDSVLMQRALGEGASTLPPA